MTTDWKPIFLTKRCSDLRKSEVESCSRLYSSHYGVWSGLGGHQAGTRIKLPPSYYEKYKEHKDMYVSLCKNKGALIGQAFFLKKILPDGKKCIWVTQLVVRSDFRRLGVATKLLQSAWGFSDYFAWGLATTNAVTVKTLESVTWREVDPQFISDNLDVIDTLCQSIEFVRDADKIVSKCESQINSHFFPDFQHLDNDISNVYIKKLGPIRRGYEWLAFTFQTQEMFFNQTNFDKLLDFSTGQIQDAYGRMKMSQQKWTKHTSHEITTLERKMQMTQGARVLDMGCGIGRHSKELAGRGYKVNGIDFSHRLIQIAQRSCKRVPNVKFAEDDCRRLKTKARFDYAICLYDVIGSFREESHNRRIAENLYKRLKTGGKAAISVMNMDLTSALASNVTRIKDNPQALLKLKASNIMQSSGNVFNPEYFILDSESHLVYRKEQFERDGLLSSEYVIADYRYTSDEICSMLQEVGFKILESQYVQAGHWDTPLEPTNPKAKEILVIVEKEA